MDRREGVLTAGSGLRLVLLNAVYEAAFRNPEALLARYTTLTGWARAVRDAGADVTIVQRFSRDAHFVHDEVPYVFVRDEGPPFPGPMWTSPALAARVTALEPQVTHVNGLMFPALVTAVRSAWPQQVIVAQDHAGCVPPRGGWLTGRWRRRIWQSGFDATDACSFTGATQATPWREAGLLAAQPVLDIVESSTTLSRLPRDEARRATGVFGAPAILWLGRLDENKDPLTVLDGIERVAASHSGVRMWMIYQSGALEATVQTRIARSHVLAERVAAVGAVPYPRVASYLSAADLFVSGSHREGSGYALIEAMACGAVPVVTDIPPFRAIAADCGLYWPVGVAAACATAITEAAALDLNAWRDRATSRFSSHLSWQAIGERTVSLYAELHARRQTGASR